MGLLRRPCQYSGGSPDPLEAAAATIRVAGIDPKPSSIGDIQTDREFLARPQPVVRNPVMFTAESEYPSNDGASGIAVSECAHRVPESLLEPVR